ARPGTPVDTHCRGLVRGWQGTAETDPDKIEAAVGALFPKSDWTMLSHHVIFHGRRICHSRKPACGACPIAPLCPAYGEGETDPEKAKKLLKYEKAGLPGQRLKPPAAYLEAGGTPAPPLRAACPAAAPARPARTAPRPPARRRLPPPTRARHPTPRTPPPRTRVPTPASRPPSRSAPTACPTGSPRSSRLWRPCPRPG